MTTVRLASDADRGAVLELWKSSDFGEIDSKEWRSLTTGGCAKLLVADDGDEVVGTVVAAFDGWRAFLYHVAVVPDRRGEGLARLLMDEALNGLQSMGARRAFALVQDINTAGLALCATMGFELEGDVAWVKDPIAD